MIGIYTHTSDFSFLQVFSDRHILPDRGQDRGDGGLQRAAGAGGLLLLHRHHRPVYPRLTRSASYLFSGCAQEPLQIHRRHLPGHGDSFRNIIQVRDPEFLMFNAESISPGMRVNTST